MTGNILLIIRAEIVCIAVLCFLMQYTVYLKLVRYNRFFVRLWCYAFSHVVLDLITVWTVNHQEIVPLWMNRTFHGLFYMTAIMFCYEMFCYTVSISFDKRLEKKIRRIGLAVPIIYLILIPFLRIDYLQGKGSMYSFGPCVFVGYSIAVLFFMASGLVILTRMSRLESNQVRSLLPMYAFMFIAVLIQVMVPELLFTGADVTMVMVGMFFAIMDPAGHFKKEAYYDTCAEIHNRNLFTFHMKELDQLYGTNLGDKNVFCVMCDMNGLKQINDHLGHEAGDEMIRITGKILQQHMKGAYGVYRIGGDEFAAIYADSTLREVEREIFAVKQSMEKAKPDDRKWVTISFGYAKGEDGETLYETMKRADARMMTEKRNYYMMAGHDRRRSDA